MNLGRKEVVSAALKTIIRRLESEEAKEYHERLKKKKANRSAPAKEPVAVGKAEESESEESLE